MTSVKLFGQYSAADSCTGRELLRRIMLSFTVALKQEPQTIDLCAFSAGAVIPRLKYFLGTQKII
jgi:hypothetical protein